MVLGEELEDVNAATYTMRLISHINRLVEAGRLGLYSHASSVSSQFLADFIRWRHRTLQYIGELGYVGN